MQIVGTLVLGVQFYFLSVFSHLLLLFDDFVEFNEVVFVKLELLDSKFNLLHFKIIFTDLFVFNQSFAQLSADVQQILSVEVVVHFVRIRLSITIWFILHCFGTAE